MTPIADVASSGDVSRTDCTKPPAPTIDSAQATQYVADSKMNVQAGQQGWPHSRHVTWKEPCLTVLPQEHRTFMFSSRCGRFGQRRGDDPATHRHLRASAAD